ncbi:MAG: hypothetical protein GX478_00130 [Erysipelotrichaceae bacterium]|nr:hypothetical protein [Erysipelotrichaceae bacterium]
MTNNNRPVTRKKRSISARFLWLVSLLAGIAFLITFWLTPVFPLKWSLIVLGVLAVLFGLTFLLCIKTSPKNIFTKCVNILLTVVLVIGTVLIPYEVDKVTSLFNQVTGNQTIINIYFMTDSYAKTNAFTDVYQYDNDNGKCKDLSSLKDASFITASEQDSANTTYALSELKTAFSSNIKTVDKSSYIDAVAALYSNDGNFLIMPAIYQATIEDSATYQNFANDTEVVYSFTRTSEVTHTVKGDSTLTKKPFTIFFGGNDQTSEESGGLSLEGRTDVCMVVTVNSSSHQIAIVNMPRDSYIPNPYYGSGDSSYDKLTHLGLKGIDNTLKGLGNYLDETINNYVIVNFTTFEHIIEALGGVTVDNPYEFTALDDEYFPAGVINLTPDSALMYVREREGLPDGDFGRNMHQQMVMSAIIDKITSPSGIVNFNSMLDSIKGEFLTNLSSNAIYGLVNKQLDEGISWNVVKYHVIGETGMEVCASAPGEQLSVVYPYTNQIEYVKSVIDQVDSGEIVEQQELPDGTYTKN